MAITPNWSAILPHVMGGDFGVKMGPGVLTIVGRVAMAAFGACALTGWALRANPYLAGAAILLIIGLALYVCERCIRYAEKHPIPALMGGAELLKVIEHQMAARDKAIVGDDSPQIGGAKDAAETIENDGGKQ
jgi:hypothetical protein